MHPSLWAIATDYDGTLTLGERPAPAVLDAIARARAAGRKVVLVTGRTLPHLEAVFPEVHEHFDAVVAENGAVLARAGEKRLLAEPVSEGLAAALAKRGIWLERGEVLLACDAIHAGAALEEIGRLGLDAQLVRNRNALMVLPSGVSKGSGLREALGDLGVSFHSALGVGDAENDHALLDACELSAAVANAVPALKAHADVVTTRTAGEGVIELLDGPLLSGEQLLRPHRWRLPLGRHDDGSGAYVPGSGVNVLIAGESGSGKSYLAGLLAEQLVHAGYSICVLDPEGDHTALSQLRGVICVGGAEPLPEPEQLGRLVRHRFGSIVVDLSVLAPSEKELYTRAALIELQRQRGLNGLPHWIFFDEAHAPVGLQGLARDAFDPLHKGFCLVTYRPEDLCEKAREATDCFVFPLPRQGSTRLPSLLQVAGIQAGADTWCSPTSGNRALMVSWRGEAPRAFEVASRHSHHVRHWHKYMQARLPYPHRFFFWTREGPTGHVAANVEEFHAELRLAPEAVLAHHAERHDFSRWVYDTLQDAALALGIRHAENELKAGVETVRRGLLRAIEFRYLDEGLRPEGRP